MLMRVTLFSSADSVCLISIIWCIIHTAAAFASVPLPLLVSGLFSLTFDFCEIQLSVCSFPIKFKSNMVFKLSILTVIVLRFFLQGELTLVFVSPVLIKDIIRPEAQQNGTLIIEKKETSVETERRGVLLSSSKVRMLSA